MHASTPHWWQPAPADHWTLTWTPSWTLNWTQSWEYSGPAPLSTVSPSAAPQTAAQAYRSSAASEPEDGIALCRPRKAAKRESLPNAPESEDIAGGREHAAYQSDSTRDARLNMGPPPMTPMRKVKPSTALASVHIIERDSDLYHPLFYRKTDAQIAADFKDIVADALARQLQARGANDTQLDRCAPNTAVEPAAGGCAVGADEFGHVARASASASEAPPHPDAVASFESVPLNSMNSRAIEKACRNARKDGINIANAIFNGRPIRSAPVKHDLATDMRKEFDDMLSASRSL